MARQDLYAANWNSVPFLLVMAQFENCIPCNCQCGTAVREVSQEHWVLGSNQDLGLLPSLSLTLLKQLW